MQRYFSLVVFLEELDHILHSSEGPPKENQQFKELSVTEMKEASSFNMLHMSLIM